MNMIERRKRNMGQGGFTLIELLVVVAILAILAGVAIFAVSNLTDDADQNACAVERDTIKTAIAAAEATSDGTDTYTAYLDGTPKYFTVSGTTLSTTAAHPGGSCPTS